MRWEGIFPKAGRWSRCRTTPGSAPATGSSQRGFARAAVAEERRHPLLGVRVALAGAEVVFEAVLRATHTLALRPPRRRPRPAARCGPRRDRARRGRKHRFDGQAVEVVSSAFCRPPWRCPEQGAQRNAGRAQGRRARARRTWRSSARPPKGPRARRGRCTPAPRCAGSRRAARQNSTSRPFEPGARPRSTSPRSTRRGRRRLELARWRGLSRLAKLVHGRR